MMADKTSGAPAQLSVSLAVTGQTREILEATPAARLRELFSEAVALAVAKAAGPPEPAEPENGGAEVTWRRVVVAKDAGEQHYALGVVMEPDSEDTQGDAIVIDDIEKSQQGFMEAYADGYGDKTAKRGHIGKMHKSIVDGKVVILESWIQREDTTIGGEAVKKGSWLMAVRVKDDGMWEEVKKGDLTGFSFAGMATRIKDKAAA